jgi:actin-related protein
VAERLEFHGLKCRAAVLADGKGVDPQVVSWKGAAIVAKEAACSALWINEKEWAMEGFSLVRARAPFYT